jgi:hypothetical protein
VQARVLFVPTPRTALRTHRDVGGPSVEALVRTLPAPLREILVETYFRRSTPQQAARRLGLAPAEAAARLYEAMHQLAYAVDGLTEKAAARQRTVWGRPPADVGEDDIDLRTEVSWSANSL